MTDTEGVAGAVARWDAEALEAHAARLKQAVDVLVAEHCAMAELALKLFRQRVEQEHVGEDEARRSVLAELTPVTDEDLEQAEASVRTPLVRVAAGQRALAKLCADYPPKPADEAIGMFLEARHRRGQPPVMADGEAMTEVQQGTGETFDVLRYDLEAQYLPDQ